MDLREIGSILREERERQGLSLEEVSDKIKITRTCLAAIEEGNEGALPHPVYAKGFIKNYAKLLGVDQETFLKGLAEVYQPEEQLLHEVPLLQDIPDEDAPCCSVKPVARLRPLPVVLAIAGVLLLAGLGWYVFGHVASKPSEEAPATSEKAVEKPVPTVSSPTEPAVAPSPQQAVTPPAVTEQPTASAPKAEPASVAETKSQPEPTPEDQATQDIATSGPATPTASTVPPAAPESVATASAKSFSVGDRGAHVVSIVAKERCWLQAGADGGTMREAMLEKGETFTGRFSDYLLVRLGNAGAVEIRFDNKLYPLQAGKGSVKTLKFVAKKTEDESAKGATTSETPAPAAPVASETPASVQTASPGETAQGAKAVEIYGQDGSWVIVSPDKGPSKEIYVKKGQRISVPFDDKIEIKLGNPSNVVFRYDGKETPVTTEKGEVKTIHFP